MDRILLNPWVSRAGNLSFLIATGVLVYRLVRGQDPLWVLTITLLFVGIVLMAAPRFEKWRLPRESPSWSVQADAMGPKQRSHLDALAREREGYVARLNAGNDRLSQRDLKSRIAQVDEQIVKARDAWWEPEPRFDLLTPSLDLEPESIAYLRIRNDGPTIPGVRINLYAPKRRERQWLARLEGPGHTVAPLGSTDDIDDELIPGFPKAVRWSEANLEIDGFTVVEMRFFLPAYPGDPVFLKLGADALGGWNTWQFTLPAGGGRGFRIVRASYGAGDKKADVTSRLNELIEDGRLDVIADNPTLVLGADPAPNEFKTLIVRFEVDGEEKSIAFNEGTHLTLPD